MLPLWIIDITNQSERRDEFIHLVEQIEHVFISKKNNSAPTDVETNETASYHDNTDGNGTTQVGANTARGVESEQSSSVIEKTIVSEEERKATRNAKLKGNYWFYSSYEYSEFFDELKDNNCVEELKDTANRLYNFQEALVKDAKKFILELRSSNAKPYQPITDRRGAAAAGGKAGGAGKSTLRPLPGG